MLAEMSGSTHLCSGDLSARDGVLPLAGHGGTALLEKGKWQLIFHPGEREQA